MYTQSGCFGSHNPAGDNGVIDNVAEVSATVDEILEGEGLPTTSEAPSAETQAATLLMRHYANLWKRVQMLTWAVVAIAIVLVIKETK